MSRVARPTRRVTSGFPRLAGADFAPFPGTPARALFTEQVIDKDLDRLADMQEQDGGWTVDYAKISPAGALEWRGYATVHAIQILRPNDRL